MDVLDQMIAQQPSNMQPVLSQSSSMLKTSSATFDTHVQDNESVFQQFTSQLTSQASRTVELERRADFVMKDGNAIAQRVDAIEGEVGTSKSALDEIKSHVDELMSNGMQTVSAIGTIDAKIVVNHDVVNALGSNLQQFATNVEQLKSTIDHVEIAVAIIDDINVKLEALETKVNNLPTTGGTTTSQSNVTALKNESCMREIVKFGNKASDDFRQWQESVKDLASSRDNGLEALVWAEESTIECNMSDVESLGSFDIAREIWGVLGINLRFPMAHATCHWGTEWFGTLAAIGR